MTECSDFEEKCDEQLCTWAERFEIASDVVVVRGNGVDSGRALLEAALGSAEAVDVALGHVPADLNAYRVTDDAQLVRGLANLDAGLHVWANGERMTDRNTFEFSARRNSAATPECSGENQ
ncbi:hypothetical protein JOE66_002786 [Subtercola frigoramans]|uniref:Uncharacterized protein n=1 Tax=Subtercola frigoramans TaxID=120298 RepID=A0ABS2L7U4_9MICO|nr:hypothetical protein [Subtercola frigoramans]